MSKQEKRALERQLLALEHDEHNSLFSLEHFLRIERALTGSCSLHNCAMDGSALERGVKP